MIATTRFGLEREMKCEFSPVVTSEGDIYFRIKFPERIIEANGDKGEFVNRDWKNLFCSADEFKTMREYFRNEMIESRIEKKGE